MPFKALPCLKYLKPALVRGAAAWQDLAEHSDVYKRLTHPDELAAYGSSAHALLTAGKLNAFLMRLKSGKVGNRSVATGWARF